MCLMGGIRSSYAIHLLGVLATSCRVICPNAYTVTASPSTDP